MQDRVEPDELAARLLAPDGLTARQTTFTMPELVRAVAGSLPQGASVEDVLETADRAVALPRRRAASSSETRRAGRPGSRPASCSKSSARQSSSRSAAGTRTRRTSSDGRCYARLLHEPTLTNEQRQLVLDASLSPDRVVCVVGVAGAGKTTALHALADAHRDSDIPVLGSGAERPRRRRAPSDDRHPQPHPAPAAARRRADGGLPHRLRAGRRRGRDGRDARARTAARARPPGGRQGAPGRRPGPAAGGRRRRPLPRPLRTTRRARTHRQPPPARPDRTGRARPTCATATPSPTSPTPPATAASRSPTNQPPRNSGCSRTGGGAPSTTSPAQRCSPTAASTSTTSTTPPTPSCSAPAGSAPTRLSLADANSASATASSAATTTPTRNPQRHPRHHRLPRRRRAHPPPRQRRDPPGPPFVRGRVPRAWLRAHRPRRPRRHPRTRLRPPPRPGRTPGMGLRRLHPCTNRHPPLPRRQGLDRARDAIRRPDTTAPPERAARALERSAGEPLALDQTTGRDAVGTRLHARRQGTSNGSATEQSHGSPPPMRAQTGRLVEPREPTLRARTRARFPADCPPRPRREAARAGADAAAPRSTDARFRPRRRGAKSLPSARTAEPAGPATRTPEPRARALTWSKTSRGVARSMGCPLSFEQRMTRSSDGGSD